MRRSILAAVAVLALATVAEAGPLRRSSACVNGSCAGESLAAVPKPLAVEDRPKPLVQTAQRLREARPTARVIRAIWWLLNPGWFR